MIRTARACAFGVSLSALITANARTPERRYNGSNNGRYMNPEMDRLVAQYQSTIPFADRMQVATQIVHLYDDDLPVLPLFYDAIPVFIANRITNVPPSTYMGWNVNEWDLAS